MALNIVEPRPVCKYLLTFEDENDPLKDLASNTNHTIGTSFGGYVNGSLLYNTTAEIDLTRPWTVMFDMQFLSNQAGDWTAAFAWGPHYSKSSSDSAFKLGGTGKANNSALFPNTNWHSFTFSYDGTSKYVASSYDGYKNTEVLLSSGLSSISSSFITEGRYVKGFYLGGSGSMMQCNFNLRNFSITGYLKGSDYEQLIVYYPCKSNFKNYGNPSVSCTWASGGTYYSDPPKISVVDSTEEGLTGDTFSGKVLKIPVGEKIILPPISGLECGDWRVDCIGQFLPFTKADTATGKTLSCLWSFSNGHYVRFHLSSTTAGIARSEFFASVSSATHVTTVTQANAYWNSLVHSTVHYKRTAKKYQMYMNNYLIGSKSLTLPVITTTGRERTWIPALGIRMNSSTKPLSCSTVYIGYFRLLQNYSSASDSEDNISDLGSEEFYKGKAKSSASNQNARKLINLKTSIFVDPKLNIPVVNYINTENYFLENLYDHPISSYQSAVKANEFSNSKITVVPGGKVNKYCIKCASGLDSVDDTGNPFRNAVQFLENNNHYLTNWTISGWVKIPNFSFEENLEYDSTGQYNLIELFGVNIYTSANVIKQGILAQIQYSASSSNPAARLVVFSLGATSVWNSRFDYSYWYPDSKTEITSAYLPDFMTEFKDWTHIALVVRKNILRVFMNGREISTDKGLNATEKTLTVQAEALLEFNPFFDCPNDSELYIDDWNAERGARWQANFMPPTEPILDPADYLAPSNATAATGLVDIQTNPYNQSTTKSILDPYIVCGIGASGSKIVDLVSENKWELGNAQIISQNRGSKFNPYCFNINNSSMHIVSLKSPQDYYNQYILYHNEDYTISFWNYKTSRSSSDDIIFWIYNFSKKGALVNSSEIYSQKLQLKYRHDSPELRSDLEYPLNTWIHIALVNHSGTLKLYQDGVLVGSKELGPSDNIDLSKVKFGYNPDTTYNYPGYIDDLFIVRKCALWTGNSFTPPTEAFCLIDNNTPTFNFHGLHIL